MRALPILLILLGLCGTNLAARAESNECKACGEVLRACLKNHSRDACTTEHNICMKHCRGK